MQDGGHHTPEPPDLPLLNDLQPCVILPNVLCDYPVCLHGGCNALATALCSNWFKLLSPDLCCEIHDSHAYKIEMTREHITISFLGVLILEIQFPPEQLAVTFQSVTSPDRRSQTRYQRQCMRRISVQIGTAPRHQLRSITHPSTS